MNDTGSAGGSNVDVAEIAKFDALASRWWDPDGDFRTLHAINPLRVDYIRQRTELTGRAVADVGCGGGILAEALAGAGAVVTGIDMAQEAERDCAMHVLPSQALNAQALLVYAKNALGATRVAVLHDTGYGRAIMDSLRVHAASFDISFPVV